MPDFQISLKARFPWSRVIRAGFIAFIAAQTALAFGRKIILSRQIGRRLDGAQTELSLLVRENLELKKEKEALFLPEKIEQLAREKLGLVKPNEIAVKIIRRDSPPTAVKNKASPSKTLWGKLKEELPVKWLLKSGRS